MQLPLSRAVTLSLLVAACAACSESGTQLGGAAQLVSLTVAPLALSPPFAPDIYDYTIRCGPGPNSLSVAMTAAPGSTATLQLPEAPTSVTPDAVTLDASEDDAIVVQVTGDALTHSYWIRCLPHDFPALTFTPHPSAGALAPGWYVLGDAESAAGESGFAMVLDGRGTPVWYHRVAASGVMDVSRRQDGSLAYIPYLGYFGADATATFVVQALSPWTSHPINAVGTPTDEHELHVLSNGNALVFSYPLVEGVDLTGLGAFGAAQTIADCEIQELDTDGSLLWTWRASDHIDPVREAPEADSVPVGGQTVVDVFHCNSIDVDTVGNVLVSARNTDAVFYIEKTSGRILWKLGGPPYSKDGAQLVRVVDDPQGSFSCQHDARFQPDGVVSMFDDHTSLAGVARGVEYAIDLPSSTARVAWQTLGPTSSVAMGSFRSTSDGTWIVGWGMSTHPGQFDTAFTEVSASGQDLLDMSFVRGDATYRASKVAPGDFDVDVLRATAGRP